MAAETLTAEVSVDLSHVVIATLPTSTVQPPPGIVVSPPSPTSESAIRSAVQSLPAQQKILRPLCLSEAHQITILLHQSLFPVRTSSKGLMAESIRLAEELHGAGIRWDKRRRVMGLHLRGIWNEGEKAGNGGGAGTSGHRAMQRYVQGSFLTTADDPHPLDSRPIPIAIDKHSQLASSLPKFTLQAGLAQALGATVTTGSSLTEGFGFISTTTVQPDTTVSFRQPACAVAASVPGPSPMMPWAREWEKAGGRRSNRRWTGLNVVTNIPSLAANGRICAAPFSVSPRSRSLAYRSTTPISGGSWTARVTGKIASQFARVGGTHTRSHGPGARGLQTRLGTPVTAFPEPGGVIGQVSTGCKRQGEVGDGLELAGKFAQMDGGQITNR